MKFKSKEWTCKIARKVLKHILEVEGFGAGSKKTYGKPKDEPDSWPDTISWETFKSPSFAKLETCNEIIESFLESRQTNVNSYHVGSQEHLENEGDEAADGGEETGNDQYIPPQPILDPTGYWRWNVETQQWIPTQEITEPTNDEMDPFIDTALTF